MNPPSQRVLAISKGSFSLVHAGTTGRDSPRPLAEVTPGGGRPQRAGRTMLGGGREGIDQVRSGRDLMYGADGQRYSSIHIPAASD